MSFHDLSAQRYSVRDFAPTPVEEEKLQAILATGRLAPTACNNQPQQIFVAESQQALDALRAITPCVFNAPVVLVLAARESEAWVNPFSQHNSAETDISIVGTHMMLQAAELGLGSTWVQWADLAAVKEKLALPEDVTVYSLLNLGYPSEKAEPAPQHTQKKELQETVTRL
jgi:nitroreductase